MVQVNRVIEYQFFYWGPFLYKTVLKPKELQKIKKLCSKKTKKHNNKLAGLRTALLTQIQEKFFLHIC